MKLFKTGGLSQTNRQFLTILGLALVAVALSSVSSEAYAGFSMAIPTSGKSPDAASQNISGSLFDGVFSLKGLSYICLLFFGIIAAFKWNEYFEQQKSERISIKIPATYTVISVLYFCLAMLLESGVDTIWRGIGTVVTQN